MLHKQSSWSLKLQLILVHKVQSSSVLDLSARKHPFEQIQHKHQNLQFRFHVFVTSIYLCASNAEKPFFFKKKNTDTAAAHCPVSCSADDDGSSPQWHSLSKEEQAKYYEMARKERLVHSKLYPGWSARDNYVSAGSWVLKRTEAHLL